LGLVGLVEVDGDALLALRPHGRPEAAAALVVEGADDPPVRDEAEAVDDLPRLGHAARLAEVLGAVPGGPAVKHGAEVLLREGRQEVVGGAMRRELARERVDLGQVGFGAGPVTACGSLVAGGDGVLDGHPERLLEGAQSLLVLRAGLLLESLVLDGVDGGGRVVGEQGGSPEEQAGGGEQREAGVAEHEISDRSGGRGTGARGSERRAREYIRTGGCLPARRSGGIEAESQKGREGRARPASNGLKTREP
jgi:hypothetical protein